MAGRAPRGRFPVELPAGQGEEVWRLLQEVDEWGFCCFELASATKLGEATEGRPLLFLVWHLIHTRCGRGPTLALPAPMTYLYPVPAPALALTRPLPWALTRRRPLPAHAGSPLRNLAS